jgi:hypothetical protein
MTKFSKKSALLFAAVMALAAFALPAGASATGWEQDGAGTTAHTLTSTNLAFDVGAPASAGSVCTNSRFHTDLVGTTLTVTSASFAGCSGTGANGSGCSVVATPTNFHWTSTAPALTNVTVSGVNVDVAYSGTCALNGRTVSVTGALTGGTWTNSTHQGVFAADTGLTAHTGLFGALPATVTGTLRDDQQTLTVQ